MNSEEIKRIIMQVKIQNNTIENLSEEIKKISLLTVKYGEAMSRAIPGGPRQLPQRCSHGDCTRITKMIIVFGCVNKHLGEKYLCTQHGETLKAQLTRKTDWEAHCECGSTEFRYLTRNIGWVPEDFPEGKWVLTGHNGLVIEIADDPAELHILGTHIPHPWTIHRVPYEGSA